MKKKPIHQPAGAASGKSSSVQGVIPAAALKSGGAPALESGASSAAANITPCHSRLLQAQLVFALWLLGLKCTMRRGKIAPFLARLGKAHPELPKPRELNLWIHLLLHALEKFGFLPTHDFKHYRQNPKILGTITKFQIKKITDVFITLRALQREFAPPTSKAPEQILLELLVAVRRRLEESPEAITEVIRVEVASILACIDQDSVTRPPILSSRNKSGMKTGQRRLLKRGKTKQKTK